MMNLKSLTPLLGASTLALAVIATGSPAQAITISTTPNTAFSNVAGATTITFTGATAGQGLPYIESGVTYEGLGRIVQNSISGRYAAPPSQPLEGYNNSNNNYLTLGAQGANQEPGPVTIKLPRLSDYFGLYWGSVDTYNSIRFFQTGVQVGKTFTGNDVFTAPNGDQSVNGARYVNFFSTGSSDWFDSIEFSSTSAAFESDNHAFREIPTPALLPGLIGMGIAALRRKQDEEVAEENV